MHHINVLHFDLTYSFESLSSIAFYCLTIPDLALEKTTEQSSTSHNGFSNRAVDGDYSIQWDKGSCTHTRDEVDPWWRVDLGKEYIVTGTCACVFNLFLRVILERAQYFQCRIRKMYFSTQLKDNLLRAPFCLRFESGT